MTISVIIPTLNEAGAVAKCLASVRTQSPLEILVIDGGSSDTTRQLASSADRILVAPRGRANQMNAGARLARGSVLLFLHADCTLEAGALHDAERLLAHGANRAGCFRMTVQAGSWMYRSIDACASMRVRLTGLIYGDQGLFVRRADFERLGGFPPLRLMEDVFFSRALRAEGRIVVSPRRIFVSPRRWQQSGLLRQTLRNWMLTALAASGVHPDRLAQHYPIVR